jgi:hypothetical protein
MTTSNDSVSRPSAQSDRPTVRWTLVHVIGAVMVLAVAITIRAILLPSVPFREGDLDVFARWAHEVAVGPFGHAYGGDINLLPIMVYIWGVLGALQPAFLTAIDASDETVRIFLKAPASLADIGLVIAAMWSLRDRPGLAIVGGLAVGIHPVFFSDSAWWGQTDALYLLPAFIAFLFARAGKPVPAAIALGTSVMTKPQAAIFLVPFAAYALRRLDRRQLLLSVGSLFATIAILWSPFILAGGPGDHLHTVATLQTGVFASISIGAWNAWWIAGQVLPDSLLVDSAPMLGPINAREIGMAMAVVGEIIVFFAVWSVPSLRRLGLGLATATLIAFCVLTAMHERYSLGALVFLIPLLPDRRILAIWVALSVAVTGNMLLTEPPGFVARVGVIGAGVIMAMTLACIWLLTLDDALAASAPSSSSSDPPGIGQAGGDAGQPAISVP